MGDSRGLMLIYSIELDGSGDLHQGRLALIDADRPRIIGRWRATSGLAQYQDVGDWQKKGGGVIPATYQLDPPINCYTVDTMPINQQSVRGIEGNSYAISPNEVTTENGTRRGEFLIHRDANIPGTLGCIGVSNSDWADFEKVFKIHNRDYDRVPLLVLHTY